MTGNKVRTNLKEEFAQIVDVKDRVKWKTKLWYPNQ